MKRQLLIASGLLWVMAGCKSASVTGQPTAPTLSFSQATNATLLGLHKYAMDTAASVKSGKETMSAANKQIFDAFAAALNAADAVYIAFCEGQATQAQVSAAVSKATALEANVQTATTGVK